ncbi:MAG: hypothetical protein M3O70_27475 [Actinomycetota bacterium]|nr:hypothetical protein [Actinomycetota bacterium]
MGKRHQDHLSDEPAPGHAHPARATHHEVVEQGYTYDITGMNEPTRCELVIVARLTIAHIGGW